MSDPLSTLHAVADNKPGTVFTSRDAQAVVAQLDELSDAIIYLRKLTRKSTKRSDIVYENQITASLAKVMIAHE